MSLQVAITEEARCNISDNADWWELVEVILIASFSQFNLKRSLCSLFAAQNKMT